MLKYVWLNDLNSNIYLVSNINWEHSSLMYVNHILYWNAMSCYDWPLLASHWSVMVMARKCRICPLFFWMKVANTALTEGLWCQRAAATVVQELQSRAVTSQRCQSCSWLMGEVLTESETAKRRERWFSQSVQGQFNQQIPQRGRTVRKQKRWIKQSERLLMSTDGLTKHLRRRIKALSLCVGVYVYGCVSLLVYAWG